MLYEHDEEAICSNFVARMPVAQGHESRFLTYLHQALYGLRVPEESIKQTTGIQNLDSDEYLNEKVALPPYPEQRAIADFLDRKTIAIDALIEKKELLLARYEERRRASHRHGRDEWDRQPGSALQRYRARRHPGSLARQAADAPDADSTPHHATESSCRARTWTMAYRL